MKFNIECIDKVDNTISVKFILTENVSHMTLIPQVKEYLFSNYGYNIKCLEFNSFTCNKNGIYTIQFNIVKPKLSIYYIYTRHIGEGLYYMDFKIDNGFTIEDIIDQLGVECNKNNRYIYPDSLTYLKNCSDGLGKYRIVYKCL